MDGAGGHPAGPLFLEAGNKVPGLATAGLPARSLLLLSPGGPGLPPFWVTGGIALAALAALLLTARRSLVLAGWSVALLGLLISVAVSRILVTPPGAARPITAWPGISLALAAAGLVFAAVVAADVLPAQLAQGRWRQPRGLGILLLAVVAASAPLLAAASWVTSGVRGPIGGSAGPVLPAFVSVSSDTGLRPRTLVLRTSPQGGVSYEVLRGADPLLGTADLSQPQLAQQALDSAVSTLVAPHGGDVQDQGQALAGLGIGYVLLPAPADTTLASTLDNVAALLPVSKTSSFELWRVADMAARVRVIGPGGTVVAVPSGTVAVSGAAAPHGGGTLVLAEPAGGWSATLNGTPLPPLASPADGWAQAFRLPAGGGTLDISHSQLSRDLIVAFELLALLVVIGLGLPGARMPGESAAQAAGPASRPAAARAPGLTRPRCAVLVAVTAAPAAVTTARPRREAGGCPTGPVPRPLLPGPGRGHREPAHPAGRPGAGAAWSAGPAGCPAGSAPISPPNRGPGHPGRPPARTGRTARRPWLTLPQARCQPPSRPPPSRLSRSRQQRSAANAAGGAAAPSHPPKPARRPGPRPGRGRGLPIRPARQPGGGTGSERQRPSTRQAGTPGPARSTRWVPIRAVTTRAVTTRARAARAAKPRGAVTPRAGGQPGGT